MPRKRKTHGAYGYTDRRKPGEKVHNLPVMEWWMKVGTSEAEDVALEAGTSYEHFKHLAYGRRKASPDLAMRLHEASDGGISVASLLGIPSNALQ